MTISVTLKELRPKLPKIMREVENRMERVMVTRRGYPCAIILSPEDFEALLETLEILQDKAGMARLKKAKREVKARKTRTLAEIRKSLSSV